MPQGKDLPKAEISLMRRKKAPALDFFFPGYLPYGEMRENL